MKNVSAINTQVLQIDVASSFGKQTLEMGFFKDFFSLFYTDVAGLQFTQNKFFSDYFHWLYDRGDWI